MVSRGRDSHLMLGNLDLNPDFGTWNCLELFLILLPISFLRLKRFLLEGGVVKPQEVKETHKP